MEIKSETKWLCEHARSLEKYSGKWVAFRVEDGVIKSGESLEKILSTTRKSGAHENPFVFHVPSKRELIAPLIVPRKK